MATVASLEVELKAFTSDFTRKLDSSLKPVQRLGDSLTGLTKRVLGLGAAFIGFKLGSSFVSGLRNSADQLDRIGKVSSKLGIAVDALQELRFGAGQSGVEIQTLDMALQRMTRRLAEASVGKGEALPALAELGLDPGALARLAPDQQLYRIADAMQEVQSQSDRVRIAFKLFDSEGVGMVNLLDGGSQKLRMFATEARQAGLVLDDAGVRKVEAANDSLTKARKSIEAVVDRITIRLAPSLEKLGEALVRLTPLLEEFAGLVDRAFGDKIAEGMGRIGNFAGGVPGSVRALAGLSRAELERQFSVPVAPQERLRTEAEQMRDVLMQRRDRLRGLLPGLASFDGTLGAPSLLTQGSVGAAEFLNQFRNGGQRTSQVQKLIDSARKQSDLLDRILRELERIEGKLSDGEEDTLFGFSGS